MKKAAALLLCAFMLCASCLTVYAEDEAANTSSRETVITAEVPDSHELTVKITGNVTIKVNGEEGTKFKVPRLSEPVLELIPHDGERIVKVTINDVDMTDQFVDNKYVFPPLYEDKDVIVNVVTEPIPENSSGSSSEPDSSTSDSGQNSNPVTGIAGGLSVGAVVVLSLVIVGKKRKEK